MYFYIHVHVLIFVNRNQTERLNAGNKRKIFWKKNINGGYN